MEPAVTRSPVLLVIRKPDLNCRFGLLPFVFEVEPAMRTGHNINRRSRMTLHKVGTREEHLAARLALLEAEKELTRHGDELARRRRELPWIPVEKEYTFDTDDGQKTLRELFDGRSQLLVYHFMFGPKWTEGCPLCSYWADSFNGAIVHLKHRDLTMVCASRAPVAQLDAYKRRMGWSFPWASSGRSDFNYDFGVSVRGLDAGNSQPEMERATSDRADEATYNFTKTPFGAENPGLSAFALDDGVVYHTYSCYARGLDAFNTANQLLDRAPSGRDEDKLPLPFVWIRRHDEYESC
jgi:predicted dithiol-disulfide oxidoreductase (DUF899 family)